MKHSQIPPFFFPTTVIFVDDSTDYLQNLSLQLDSSLAFQLFDSPIHALAALNGTNSRPTLVERIFSRYHDTEDMPLSHHVIDVNLDKVHREVYNEFRFEQISVAVVDYDMPSIDGLEFCMRIKNPAVKKVLLTGKADEKIAVHAFNQGIIDRFILKQDQQVINTLNQAIHELQRVYFTQTERMLADALAIGKHAFLRDTLFAQKFAEICEKLQVVEFYLCSEPDGMLMLDADGATTLLIVSNEEGLRSQYEIACEEGAPQELLDILKSNEVVPYFWKTGGYYRQDLSAWRPFLYPATEFKGEQWLYYALVKNPQPFKTNHILPYNSFLDVLDVQRRGYGS
jgi:CheY-like chemotaxis protein